MEKQTNQASLERDQPKTFKLNPCSFCGQIPQLECDEHSTKFKCSCGMEASLKTTEMSEFTMCCLNTTWNIHCISSELTETAKKTIGIEDGDFVVVSLEDYAYHSKIFHTLLDAMNYMKAYFDENLDRTSLFQLRGNEFEWIFISDEIV